MYGHFLNLSMSRVEGIQKKTGENVAEGTYAKSIPTTSFIFASELFCALQVLKRPPAQCIDLVD